MQATIQSTRLIPPERNLIWCAGGCAAQEIIVFVIIVNGKNVITDRFSYGPEKVTCASCDKGKLVETRGDPDSPTNIADSETARTRKDETARTALNQFGVTDKQVRASGQKVDEKLGTTEKPGDKAYSVITNSSNTGAAEVLDGAQEGLSQKVQRGLGFTPGWPLPTPRCNVEIGCRNTG